MSSRHPIFALLGAAGLLAAGAGTSPAQCPPDFVREMDPFLVIDGLGPVEHAFFGGWEDPRPQLFDVEGDGDVDLFVAEEAGKIRFFRNDGTPALADFRYMTDDYAQGVHTLYFARLHDLDGDGVRDLLVEAPPFEEVLDDIVLERTGARLFFNEGTGPDPVWVNRSTHPDGLFCDENGDPIAFDTTTPDFVDLDHDLDLDLILGKATGTLVLYRNVGTPASPVFRFETDNYRDITIISGQCSQERAAPAAGAAHGFMLLSFQDLNNDSRPDLFVGDSFNSNVYHYLNVGPDPDPDYVCQTESYFPNGFGGPGSFGLRLLSAFGDLDGDGDLDAVFGSGETSSLGLHLYRNEGTPTFPFHRQESTDWLSELDLGQNTAPAFADLDRDGDDDLYLGMPTRQAVSRWDNVADAANPQLAVIFPQWTSVSNSDWLAGEFADIDTDGDLDFFLGGTLGEIRWYRNDGDGPDPSDFTEVLDDPQFGGQPDAFFRLNVSSQAIPRFLDADADGDLDLVVGYFATQPPENAPLLYFRNDGTPQRHDFVLASGDFAGIGPLGKSPAPAFRDLDGDGDLDGIVGRFDGTLTLLMNVGTPAVPAFERTENYLGVDIGARAVPAFADFDGDGNPELFLGESGGGLNFFRNVSTPVASPSAFTLQEPVADQAIDGRTNTLFTWNPSFVPGGGAEAEYELRLTPSLVLAPDQWTVLPANRNRRNVRLYAEGLRFATDIWWTVTARDGCAMAPVPEWRHIVHATPDVIHGETPPQEPFGETPPVDPGTSLSIRNAFPSPSADRTTVEFNLPLAAPVRVTVHDASGRMVSELLSGTLPAGTHRVDWDGRNDRGLASGAGIYVVRVEQRGQVVSRLVARLRP